ncbi:MAG: ribosome maturation factor RimP [Actinomycetota bacterium]
MADIYDKERSLFREVSSRVERSLPGVEVLAVELSGPERFTVFVDHPKGVDHALCERVTQALRGYLEEYAIDVSSPGTEPPLRKKPHFERAVGRKVAVRTADAIAGRKRFRGELVDVGERSLRLVAADKSEPVEIPYDAIVRGNVIEEGTG